MRAILRSGIAGLSSVAGFAATVRAFKVITAKKNLIGCRSRRKFLKLQGSLFVLDRRQLGFCGDNVNELFEIHGVNT